MLPLSVLALVLVLCVSRQSDGQEKSRRSRRWHRSIQICIFRKSVSSGNISDPWEKKIPSFRVQHKPCFWMCRCCVHKTFRGLLFLYGTHFSLEVFEELQPCRRPALNLWHLRGKNCHLVADPLLCFICKNMTLVFHSVWED